MDITIKSAAHEGCREINGYIVCAGEGAELRVFGWAATMPLAKRLRADVRRNPSAFAIERQASK